MKTVEIEVDLCEEGDILATDIFNSSGVKLLSANTTINSYIKERLTSHNIENVVVYDPPICSEDKKYQYKKATDNYKNQIVAVKKVITDIASGKKLDFEMLNGLSSMFYKSEGVNDGIIIQCINDLKKSDKYTYTHSINTGLYCMMLAKWAGLDEEQVKKALVAGTLHDIGKTKIPNSILNKKSRLTDNEFDYIKKHPAYGYKILDDSNIIDSDIKQAVLYHHERINCSGYPLGVCPENIFPRMVAVADVYDAITSERPYKHGRSPFCAFRVFQDEGTGLFDTNISNIFMRHMSAYLIGADVMLESGEEGKIVYISPQNISQPIVVVDSKIINLSDVDRLQIINRT